jgi:xanthine dehydrogenase YagR molybdenum-binding subunit
MTSQYEEFSRNDTGWSALLYKSPTRNTCTSSRGSTSHACDMRAPGAATGVYALECAMDELAVALKLDPAGAALRCYSDRDQNEDVPYTSKQLRECYRQGAEAFGWDKRNPSRARCATAASWSAGAWRRASGKRCRCRSRRIVLTANGHAEVACATSDIGTGTYTIMAQVAADMLGLPIDKHHVKLGDSTLPQSPVEGGSWMAASVATRSRRRPKRSARSCWRLAKKMPDSPLAARSSTRSCSRTASSSASRTPPRGVDRGRDAARRRDRIEQEKTNSFPNDNVMHAIRIRRSSPR